MAFELGDQPRASSAARAEFTAEACSRPSSRAERCRLAGASVRTPRTLRAPLAENAFSGARVAAMGRRFHVELQDVSVLCGEGERI